MLDFYAEMFLKTFTTIHRLEVWFDLLDRTKGNLVLSGDKTQVVAEVGVLYTDCLEHGLDGAAEKCMRIMTAFGPDAIVTREYASNSLRELRERVEDDFKKHLFLHLTLKEAELYTAPTKDWTAVINRFPKTRHDIEESSKCFALGRYAASLFHVLLVAEFGVIVVADAVGVKGDKPGWTYVQQLQRVYDKKWSDKTPEEQKHNTLLGKVLPLMHAIKNEWRHKLDHVDNKLVWLDTDFSPEVAAAIISAVRGFMQTLVANLV